MKRVEDSEENLESFSDSRHREGEDGKKPGESKKEHHSTDTDHQTYDGFIADCFLLSSSCAPGVTNQNHNDPDEDDNVKKHDCKDWDKECTPEGSTVGQETTAYKSK